MVAQGKEWNAQARIHAMIQIQIRAVLHKIVDDGDSSAFERSVEQLVAGTKKIVIRCLKEEPAMNINALEIYAYQTNAYVMMIVHEEENVFMVNVNQ